MIIKAYNKIFPKRKNNKRAVSPVIATILLIALTVSAAAIVYFVVAPMLQGKAEIIQMSALTLRDNDDDGKFDEITTDLLNIGTDTVELNEIVKVTLHSTLQTYDWTITSNNEFPIQTEKEITIETDDNQTQINSLSSFEILITYGKKSIASGRQYSPYAVEGGGGNPGDDTPPLNYTSMPFVLRTAANDPSTSRPTFPTTEGYSPLLWFLVGIFQSGVSNLHTNTIDYIDTNGFGTAQDYKPYIGIPDQYSQSISAHTGYSVLPYNDSGNYPGCVTFAGTSFDAGDDIDWPQRGIVYMFTYISNPTDDPMDIDLSIQCDDAYNLWVNGNFEGSGTQANNGWRTWRSPVTVTMNPGYNIVTIKSADAGGNWDTQILFWDAGDVDTITSLVNAWPLIEPTF